MENCWSGISPETSTMMKCLLVVTGLMILSCLNSTTSHGITTSAENNSALPVKKFDAKSWEYFLRHLPTKEGEVVDYLGNRVRNGNKAAAIINYDIGNRDLQQCADAIMRLRAEYLFSQNRTSEIAFHFTDGQLYSFVDYLKGKRTVVSARKVALKKVAAEKESSHQNLRNYLDIVYAYAGTISLQKELKTAKELGVGVVIIKGGSPGHCFIIVDEKKNANGESVYKLVEGYTPAQSIYVLKNSDDETEWHLLEKGRPIETASYYFETYKMGKF